MSRRFVFIAVGAIGVVAACTSFDSVDSVEATNDGGGIDGTAATDGASTATGTGFCAAHASAKLCEDFASKMLATPRWIPSSSNDGPADTLEVVTPDSGANDPFLRVNVPARTNQKTVQNVFHSLGGMQSSVKLEVTVAANLGTTGYVEVLSLFDDSAGANATLAFDYGEWHFKTGDTNDVLLNVDPKQRTHLAFRFSPTTIDVTDESGASVGTLSVPPDTWTTRSFVLGIGIMFMMNSVGGTVEVDDLLVDY